MKLGLSPLLLAITCALVLGLLASTARAFAPRRPISQEDALDDGDVDPEDLATRSTSATPASRSAGAAVLALPSGATYVSLVGFSRRNMIHDQDEVGGFIVVGLPLDRWLSEKRQPAGPPPPPELPGVPSPTASLQRASASEAPFDLALTPQLARACVAAAWRGASIGVDDARLEAVLSRARWSAVLPEARLRAVRFDDARLSLDTGTDTSRLRDSAGANVGFEARLTWRFDRLLYADDEPSFERIRLEHRDARARIAAKVLDALFHWQRAALDLRTLPPAQQGTRDEADVILRVLEAEAALDVLTNGWFATHRMGKGSVRRESGGASPPASPPRGI